MVFDYNGMLFVFIVLFIIGVMILNCNFGMFMVVGLVSVIMLGLIYVYNVYDIML